MSVPKLKREIDTRWEINEEDEGDVETEAGETKEKKKCVAETNTKKRRKNRGKSEEVDFEIWGVFWVFFVSPGIYFSAEARYLSRYAQNGSSIAGI